MLDNATPKLYFPTQCRKNRQQQMGRDRPYVGSLPQQLPGPAHPAWAGDVPQQAVSPGPGICWDCAPESEDGAESNFLRLRLPHPGHSGSC